MSISPPSDIVLGVANAADPQRQRAAIERLARAAGEGATYKDSLLTDTAKSVAKSAAALPPGTVSTALASSRARAAASTPKAYEKFEAFFLQTFVESILPEDADSLFGSGPAGKIWKSMLAEQLANELARSAAFGIAEQIAENREDKKAEPTSSAGQASHDASAADGTKVDYLSDLQKLLSIDETQSGGLLRGQQQPLPVASG